ncbi:hypothetical protein FRC14_007332 [Serendipita sp. 396]|nr:hypothetical protein FRC14_007332 [Serendipita sp. 396]KAG8777636.1 hypothetical protein FRC15_011224 [Serendipita sp. 397]KAG8794080.1 hypothetical protein FRC16_010715 [Serendipita sp. 398]KAG8849234.1 hypothetical protein FRB91_010142 [Serendipita sp. 411]KAG8864159.1 hypothetical protein FRC20_010343 [Serendipita sp. 405]
MSSDKVFDVIIVGGGPAGCATALALHRLGENVSFILIDDADSAVFKIGESLPPEAKRLLQYLSSKLPARLEQDTSNGIHTNIVGNASAWESADVHETFAIMNPFGAGWHLDRASFDETLRETVRGLCLDRCGPSGQGPPIKVEKARFLGIEKDPRSWIVSTEEQGTNEKRQYRSKWIVDATGRKASVARKLGAKTIKKDALLAFYAVFKSPAEDWDHRTLIEATETGWWYTSQLANHTRIVVYHTDDTDPSSKHARKREGFLNLLYTDTTHISKTIEDNDYQILAESNYPRCTAACSSYLEPMTNEAECWTAVGDAAMAFDPLSSQGMITALRSGCLVGEILCQRLDGVKREEAATQTERSSIEEVFLPILSDYEKKKKLFYGLARFDGEFWMRRR